MTKPYFMRDHISAFNNALMREYNMDGVMYMCSYEETQHDGNVIYFDSFKHKVTREKFRVEYQRKIYRRYQNVDT